MGAVAHEGICQADGSSDGFCQGWQLVAEVANEKNTLFFPGTPLIYEVCLEIPTRRMSAESQVPGCSAGSRIVGSPISSGNCCGAAVS
jgi:hypothetical protein